MNNLVIQLIAPPIILFIPGFFLFIALDKKLPIKPVDFFLAIIYSATISSLTGLLLAQLGLFGILNLSIALILTALPLIIMQLNFLRKFSYKEYITSLRENIKDFIIPLMIVIVSVGVLFPGYPWIFGGRDPGVYISTGVNIAKTGQIKIYDEEVENMTAEEIKSFLHYEPRKEIVQHKGYMYVGFYLTNPETGEVTPQFFLLYQIWIAIFYSIFNISGAINATPILGLLGILSTYFFAEKLFKNKKLVILTILISFLSFTQIWWSKYPNAEIFTQTFYITGILLLYQAIKRNRRHALLAGIIWGVQYLISTQALFLYPLTFIFGLFVRDKKSRRQYHWFLIGSTLMLIYSIAHAYIFCAPYFHARWWGVLGQTLNTRLPDLPITILIVGLLNAFYFVLNSSVLTRISFIKDKILTNRVLSIIIQVLVLASIIFGIYRIPGSTFFDNGYNLIKLSYYVGFIGIISLIGGLVLLARKKSNNYIEYLLPFLVTFMLVISIKNANISRDHPWWSRRFFPIILGVFPYLSTLFVSRFWEKKNKILKYGSVLFLGSLILTLSGANLLLFNYQEHPKALDQLQYIDSKINDNSIIIFPQNIDNREEYLVGYFIAQPLRFIYGHKTFILNENKVETSVINNKISNWLQEGKSVYLMGTNPTFNSTVTDEFYIEKITDYQSDFQQRGWRSVFYPKEWKTDNHLIKTITTYTISDSIYQFSLKTEEPQTTETIIQDIGSENEGLFASTNLYEKEITDETSYRWSQPDFSIIAPSQPQKGKTINLWASLLQTEMDRSVTIELIHCGITTEIKFQSLLNFETITIPYEQRCKDEQHLRFKISPARSPEGDQRKLGIALDKIEILSSTNESN